MATPGPWEADEDRSRVQWDVSVKGQPTLITEECRKANAVFIAAARNALPQLIAEVKAAREWLKKDDELTASAIGATTPYCGADEFTAFEAAREAYRAVVEANK